MTDTAPSSTLVFIVGPPAVGKMTVGHEIAKRTGLKLFHNHHTIDLVLRFFPFGSPPFGRLVNEFRRRIFEEVADSGLPGLIFTYVWAFDQPGDHAEVARQAEIFASRGGRVLYVELQATQEERLRRNETEFRLAEKPSTSRCGGSRDPDDEPGFWFPVGGGAGMIREFVPLEAYEEGLGPAKRRMALVMAACWGVPMTVYLVLDADGGLEIALALVVGVAGALAVGFLWTWTMTFGVRRMVRRVHGGDPRIVPAPPAGAYEYRFPCSYLPSLLMAIGGQLYLGPAAWTFVPHRGNLERHRAPVSIPITPGTQVECVEVKLPPWAGLFTPGPAYRLQVRTADATAMFLTPDPQLLATRLRAYLETASPAA